MTVARATVVTRIQRRHHGHQAHLPAPPPSSCPHARVPRTYVDAAGSLRPEVSPPPGAQAPYGGVAVVRREERLGAGVALEALFKQGAVANSPFFVLRYAPNALGHPRYAFAVGKRLAPHAVDRNATRRRLRAAVDELSAEGSWDAVLIARQRTLTATVTELANALRRTLSGVGMTPKAQ